MNSARMTNKLPAKTKLTAKQEMFVAEYLKDLNATQAAIRAGYSKNSAKEIGHENLTKPHIEEAIRNAKIQRIERTKIDADWVLTELKVMADADYAEILLPDGEINPNMNEWPEHWRTGLVSDLKQTKRRTGKGDDIDETITLDVKRPNRLEIIKVAGNHVDVGAFKTVVDMNVSKDYKNMSKDDIIEGIFEMVNDGAGR